MKNLPTIPKEEYPLRWIKVQNLMQENNLDLLIAYADDHATYGAAHVRWLSNLPAHFEPFCVLLFPTGKPILLCGPESDEYARLVCEIKDIRVLREFTHPDEDYPFSKIQGLAEIVSEVASNPKSIKRVGIAGKSLMNSELVESFESALPEAAFVNAENQILSIRAIKSQSELEVIRYAYKVAEAGIEAAIKAIKPGITEREIAAEAEYAMRKLGSEGMGIDTIVASGPNTRPILARTSLRKVEENDLVLLTIAPRYEGYHAAIGRPVVVGNPNPEIKNVIKTVVSAQEACSKAMRAGVMGSEVEAKGRNLMTKAGLGNYFLYSGLHSVGVIEFEGPIFGPSSKNTLEENMVISIDIPLFNSPFGGLRMEDGFLITKTSAEKLTISDWFIVTGVKGIILNICGALLTKASKISKLIFPVILLPSVSIAVKTMV